jgi:hypothetical protein
MKISKLLVLSAMWLTGLTASAADLIERTQPSVVDVLPTAAAFQVDHQYLLYNKGTGYFFSQGNSWGTKASGNPNQEAALRLYFTKYLNAGEWDGKTYIFKIYSSIRSTNYSWHEVFFDSPTAMFVDRASQANLYWEVIDKGNLTYNLGAAAANPTIHSGDSLFVGYDPSVSQDASNLSDVYDNANAYPLHPCTTENIEWEFYDAAIFMIYDKAQELKAKIEQMEGMYEEGEIPAAMQALIDEAAAVYNNENATLEQLQAALDKLTGSVFAGFVEGKVLDVSSLITNPDFKGDDLSGWSGSGWGSYGPKENAERFNMTFDTYQDVNGLIKGIYVVGVNAFYRAGDAASAYTNFKAQNEESKYAKLYATSNGVTTTADIVSPYQDAPTSGQGHGSESTATDEETKITYSIPNNMEAAEYYMHTLGLYKNMMFVELEGSFRLGMKKEKTVSNDWVICDDFSLLYCGEGAKAYQAYVDYYKHSLPDYAAMVTPYNKENVLASGNVNVTKDVLEAFINAQFTASTEEEVYAAIEQIKAEQSKVKENMALWAEYMATVKEAYKVSLNEGLMEEYTEILAEIVAYDAPEEWDAAELTNEELRARIEEIKAAIKDAWEHPKTGDEEQEFEATHLLTNPDYEDGTNGWTIEHVSGGNVALGGNSANHCYEAWNNANFDIYQVISGAPAGIYRIEVQGFYRYGRGQDAYNHWKSQDAPEVTPEGVPVFIYMNAKTTPFSSVFDEPVLEQYSTQNTAIDGAGPEGETCYYPDGMTSSAEAFSAGMYKRSAYGIIKKGDTMRIGVKGSSNQLGDSWVIWDNFKLFNCGQNADAVMNVLPDEVEKASKLLDKTMGKSVFAGLKKAVDDANAALAAGDDGNGSLFNALAALFDAEENVNASVAKFTELTNALTDLEDAIGEYSATATPASQAAAQSLVDEIRGNLTGNAVYEDEDVDGLLERIKKAKFDLRMPDYSNPPVEMTALIDNPNYDENGNFWTCEAGAGYGAEEAEVYNKNFDYYQDFTNMPAGVYEVGMRGFYRAGSAPEDWSRRDSVEYSHAFLYGMTVNEQGDNVYGSKPLKRLTKYYAELGEAAWGDDAEATDMTWCATDTIAPAIIDEETKEVITPAEVKYILVANMMSTANTLLTEDLAENGGNDFFLNRGVFVRVGDNGKLRIGVKKTTAINIDWTIIDSWQLWYYGNDSQIDLTGDPSAIKTVGEMVKVLSTELFTIDGRKTTAAQKGIIIEKTTLSNGAVIVRKIRK